MHHQLILADAKGRGREKRKKVKLEITRYSWNHHLLCWIYCSSKTDATSTPSPLSRDWGAGRPRRKPKTRGNINSTESIRNPGTPSTEEPNPSHHPFRTKIQNWLQTCTRTSSVQTAPLTVLFHICPLKSGRGGSAQERGQQLRADSTATSQRWPTSLAPKRTSSHTHLDSSPVASTPKCSHTAGQNCSLQVMKSSSKLARAKERFNKLAQGGAKGHSQRSHLRSLWTSFLHHGKRHLPMDPGSFGTSTCPQIRRTSSDH